ncbi:M15 family metallopeptidase [Microbacterium sp. NC79]|uniref:M15 family metallopeptidase n=1 Tax=Microbacterium sp. NC79 TaxID=2851009 RepID=UPI001C2B8992|nr:M15 family metallopeptidase [Microbacterium sp. NC79]MBV0893776.1 M15 family metallopeptidase [Microbacterium sp. NC79]
MYPPLPAARHHARSRRALLVVVSVGLAAALFGIAIGMAARSSAPAATAALQSPPRPVAVTNLPVPEITAVPATAFICSMPSMSEAIATANVSNVIAAAGGVEQFRRAVVVGTHKCVLPDDPSTVWFVVNKARPFPDTSWRPGDLTQPATQAAGSPQLRAEAAAAFDALVTASAHEGAGTIALNSGFRSYDTQVASYTSQVDAAGQTEADHQSARPGHSEHQTGLTADVVACSNGCGTLDDFGASPQGAWVVENAWRFGWITRYEDGSTGVTGYTAEPWHLRYIGVELATLYHEGGFHTLEEFFGLPAAPDYIG